jgi:hypothetical protein
VAYTELVGAILLSDRHLPAGVADLVELGHRAPVYAMPSVRSESLRGAAAPLLN